MNTLPNTYQQVEYIESNGTQYIDTGFAPNQNTNVYTKIKPSSLAGGNKSIFGYRTNVNSQHYGVTIGGTNSISWYTGYGAESQNTGWTAILDTEYEIKKEKGVLNINNNQFTQTSENFSCPGNMSIFAMHQSDTIIAYATMKLYYFKIYDNNNLVRDFIPCYRKSDNEIGLYDIVNNVFYTNNGTGTFIKGNNVTVAEKLSYVRETVDQIDEKSIDLFGEDFVENATFRELAEAYAGMYDKMNKVTASGDEVTLTPAAGKITITPKGNTIQLTTNGYNMLPYKNTTQTKNGLTFTNNGDGTLLINGTATKQTIYCINAESIAGIILDMKLESTSYRVSVGQPMSNSTFLVQLAYRKPDETIGYASVATDGGTINNLTIQDINNNAGFGLIIREGTSFDNMLIKPMLQLATTSYDFEPYTGGIASPNPDYPQDIKVVKGNNTIKIIGKNLFNKNGNIKNNYRLSTTGGNFLNNGYFISEFIPIKPSTTYSVNYTPDAYSRICYYTSNTGNPEHSFISKNDANSTFTTPNNAKYLRLCNSLTEIDNIQLQKGDTITTFEPYQETTKQLNLGNLELCKIGDYQDYFYKSNGNWYKKEIIAKQYLSDITGWAQGNPSNRFVAETTNKGNTSVLPLCTHLIGGTLNSHNNVGGIAIQNLTNTIRLNCYIQAYASNVNEFKSWITSAKPISYYVLEEAKDILITNATLINQLESLNRTIIPAQTIIIKTESNEENAKLNIATTAIRKEDGE